MSNLPFYTTLMLDFMLLIQEFDFANSITCVSLLHQVLSVYTDELLAQVRQFERVIVNRSLTTTNNVQSRESLLTILSSSFSINNFLILRIVMNRDITQSVNRSSRGSST
jgi:hypothetical protein